MRDRDALVAHIAGALAAVAWERHAGDLLYPEAGQEFVLASKSLDLAEIIVDAAVKRGDLREEAED